MICFCSCFTYLIGYVVICHFFPDIIIPCHTEYVEWFKERYGKKAKILKKGEKYITQFVI